MDNKQFLLDKIEALKTNFNSGTEIYGVLTSISKDIVVLCDDIEKLKKELIESEELIKNEVYNRIYSNTFEYTTKKISNAIRSSAWKTVVISIIVTALLTYALGAWQSVESQKKLANFIYKSTNDFQSNIYKYMMSQDLSVADQKSVYKNLVYFVSKHKIHNINKNYISLYYKVHCLFYDPLIERDVFLSGLQMFNNETGNNLKINNADLLIWENDLIKMLENIKIFLSKLRSSKNDVESIPKADLICDNFKDINDDTEYHNFSVPIFELESSSVESSLRSVHKILNALKIRNGIYEFD